MPTEHGDTHAHGHSHGCDRDGKKKTLSKTIKFAIMLAMIFGFFIVELIVGQLTNSITLIADSFHMFSDSIALCIGLVSVRVCVQNFFFF
jgi:Co/Zn/Cd efflux system component